ncbi:hypothetical protein Tco_0987828, partial [Tanacetum coccineum]
DGNIGEPDVDDVNSFSWVRIPETYCIPDDNEVIIEKLVKDGEKNVFWIINEEVQESLLNLTSIRRIILDRYIIS